MRPSILHTNKLLFWTITTRDLDNNVLKDAEDLPVVTVRYNDAPFTDGLLTIDHRATGKYDAYFDPEMDINEGDQFEFEEEITMNSSVQGLHDYVNQFYVRVIEPMDVILSKVLLLNPAPTGSVLIVSSGAYYCTRTDVELVFGQTNVLKWADLDNSGNSSFITNRITTMIALAHEQTNDALRAGGYNVPILAPIPTTLAYQVASLAGVLLYESRGAIDSESEDGTHRLTPFRKRWSGFIKDVLGQRIQLSAKRSNASNAPAVY